MKIRRRKTSVRSWARKLRCALLTNDLSEQLSDARSAFADLSPPKQKSLAREVVIARSRELCLAYSDLVSVTWGYRKKNRPNSRRLHVTNEVCVSFIVAKKWTTKGEVKVERKLPSFLFAYATVKGRRELCAIPTDVSDGADYARISPQAATGISTYGSNEFVTSSGAVACIITRPRFGTDLFAISCRHVLSISDSLPDGKWDLRVCPRSSYQTVIGDTCDVAGYLGSDTDYSFDAQLLQVFDPDMLRQTMGRISFTGAAQDTVSLPETYYVITPSGAKQARLVGMHSLVHYDANLYGSPGSSAFKCLVESIVTPATQPGDSGSPVATLETGGKLLGMHVAGNPDTGHSFMIPAWQLLNPANYQGNTEVRWTLA